MAVIDAERSMQVEPTEASARGRERVSWARFAWVGPLTVVAAMAACALVRFVAQSIDPSLTRMGQLGPAMLQLAFIGSVGAVIVFALMALVLPRPITWFRRLAVLVWAVSILPDLALGFGGSTALLGMRAMGPFLGLEIPYLSQRQGPPPGAGPRPS